jgi:hypothetical protein
MSGITNPPRYRGAEDLSGRQRAERRGGMTEAEFLHTMKRAGFRITVSDSPFYTFHHDVLGADVEIKPGDTFARMADRSIARVARMQIIKLQKPLDDPNGAWLAYPQGRKWMLMIPRATIPLAVRTVVDEEFKAFFYATRIGDSLALSFGGRAPPQSW